MKSHRKTMNKEAAEKAERKRRSELELSRAGIPTRKHAPMFGIACERYLQGKPSEWAPHTAVTEEINTRHLQETFGGKLLTDIGPEDVGQHRAARLAAGASPKTAALESASPRAVMRFCDADATWAAIAKKTKVAPPMKKMGRVITAAEESVLLEACAKSRSRSLYPAVVMAIEAPMRRSEIRLLRWRHSISSGARLLQAKARRKVVKAG
jgi:integrase